MLAYRNCFFRCLSREVYGDEEQHTKMRSEICEYMSAYGKVFECFVEGTMEEHLRHQRLTDGRIESWATEAEVFAASALYGVNIKITEDSDEPYHWNMHSFRVNGLVGEHISVAYS